LRSELLEARPRQLEVLWLEELQRDIPVVPVPREPDVDDLELAAISQCTEGTQHSESAVLLDRDKVQGLDELVGCLLEYGRHRSDVVVHTFDPPDAGAAVVVQDEVVGHRAAKAIEVMVGPRALRFDGGRGDGAPRIAAGEAFLHLQAGGTAVARIEDDGSKEATVAIDFHDFEGLGLERSGAGERA